MGGKALGYRICLIALAVCAFSGPAVADTAADVADLVAGNNAFALDLYAKLAATRKGNLFFSPYSIRTALAMVYAGARGETAEQMRKVLHFDLPDDRLHAAFAALATELSSGERTDHKPAYELTISNGLWGQSGYSYNPAFLDLLQKDYRSEMQQADFRSPEGIERARLGINDWTLRTTSGRIPNLLAGGILDQWTRLVLVDSVYLKSPWRQPFEKRQTTDQVFYEAASRSALAPMMFESTRIQGMESGGLQVIELPYDAYRLSMLVFLPRKLDGLDSVEKQLTMANLGSWIKQMAPREAEVFLPRFHIEDAFELVPVLGSMGMGDAFNGVLADFSGIVRTERLFVRHVVHKTFVDADEGGTEAAGSTAAVVEILNGPPPTMAFWANHPFIFLIEARDSGVILFMGRVVSPTN